MACRVGVIAALLVLGWFSIIGSRDTRHALYAQIEKARLLHSLRALYAEGAFSASSVTWDSGWQGICEDGRRARLYVPSEPGAAGVASIAAVGTGDFVALDQLTARPEVWAVQPSTLAYHLALQGDWIGAAQAYERAPVAAHRRFWGTILFLAGQNAFDSGDSETADRLLRKAEALYKQSGPFSSPALAACLQRWGRHEEARRELRRAAAIVPPAPTDSQLLAEFQPASAPLPAPEWVAAREAQPSYPVSVAPAAEWTVVGVDVNQDDLRQSPLLRVTTYWRTPREPDRVALLPSIVRNLVANGALEWDYAPQGVRPFGYFQLVYPKAPRVSVEREAGRSNALCLTPPLGREGTGLQGLTFPLSTASGTTLIQGGDVVSREGGSFAIGRHWYGKSTPNSYSYVALAQARGAPNEWQTLVGYVTLQPGVDSVALWLLRHDGLGGKTCYANLFMFELPPPPSAPA